ncbi:hypothetical protein DYB32_005816 [Aphanomyces invadans]|uniref:Uncharacterized protein n=1 Tax=Aphanomyces invadans TaxID=157072 RepID=A0A418ATG8_9STRA|nr:hypothetical protein DYB32_005816 [Aphanomyces invadans]
MKTGVSVPGMSGGIPMIGLTRPGIALPGLAAKEAASTEASPAPEEEPAAVSHEQLSTVTAPAVSQRASASLFGDADDDDASSDEWDDDNPKSSLFGGPAKLSPPPVVAQMAPSSSIPKKPVSNLFGASDSDSDDDAEGLFGTGVPTK